MNTKEFILSMTREDFDLFEKRKVEIYLPTKQEIQDKETQEFELKKKVFNSTMQAYNIDIFDREVKEKYWEDKLLMYFNTNRNMFAKWLGNEYVYADLTQVAKNMSKSKTVYKEFIDLVYKFNKNDILDLLL